MNINLHIEELVLDGIDITPEQRSQLAIALRSELARLIATEGVTPSLQMGGWCDQLSAGNLHYSLSQSPKVMGQRIAQSVYRGLT